MGKNLIIKGADFSAHSLPKQVLLVNGLTVANGGRGKATLRAVSGQSTVLFYRDGMGNTLWGTEASERPDKANYALNPIPAGATKITVTDTVKHRELSVCLYDENYGTLFIPSWSGSGIYTQQIDISTYPTAKFYSLNYKATPSPNDISTLTISFTY